MRTLGNYRSADHPGDSHYLPLFIGAMDEDGWIHDFTVDWGDGTTSVFVYNPFPCRVDAATGYPVGNYVSMPSDTTNPLVGLDGKPVPSTERFFAAAGTYTVTVTVTSTACDGSEPQQGSRSITWTVT